MERAEKVEGYIECLLNFVDYRATTSRRGSFAIATLLGVMDGLHQVCTVFHIDEEP